MDAGSRAIKVALVDGEKGELLASGIADQGIRQNTLALELFERVLAETGATRADVGRAVGTGYGRSILDFTNSSVTEITCHARGVRKVAPAARMIVEIGGQDSKVLWLDDNGTVRDFMMNDRCAAGTGRFLEMVASRLEIPFDRLGDEASLATSPAVISSTCVVFAETEIIGLLASGASPADIICGVQAAVASRVNSMIGRRAAEPVAFTGGVALVPGMTGALEEVIACRVSVCPAPQFTGALGAALIAAGL